MPDERDLTPKSSISMDFPSNAHSKKQPAVQERRKLSKVVTTKVKTKKKSFTKKLTETFIGEDVENVSSYIIHDVLVPAAKNTIADMIEGSINMIFFQGARRPGATNRVQRDRGVSRVSYNSISTGGRPNDRRDISPRNRASHNFDDIILATRGEAEEVISQLVDQIIDYGEATVADLYDLVGITQEFTDARYGWTNLSSATVSRAREGYLLNLPRPILLD